MVQEKIDVLQVQQKPQKLLFFLRLMEGTEKSSLARYHKALMMEFCL